MTPGERTPGDGRIGRAAIRETKAVLIVAEAMHSSARADVQSLTSAIANELRDIWCIAPKSGALERLSPKLEF
jgi:hypothetical protein